MNYWTITFPTRSNTWETLPRLTSPNFVNSLDRPTTPHIILITAAPPCKDHSRLRDQPPGTDGTDGSLLSQMTHTESYVRELLPEYTIRSMMENVIPHRNIKQHFDHITQQWGSPLALIDAADGMVMSRLRLWWTDIRWKEAESRLTKDTPFTLHWQQHNDFDQLHNPLAPLTQPSIHIKDWETPAILCQQQLFHFHCLTTQAPTDLGRPPPQHTNVDQATWDRWQNDNRQFPPWQYQPQYLTRQHQHDWQPITPLQRERLMALPDHYRKITDQHPSTRSRNTMLGNAWHFPFSPMAHIPYPTDHPSHTYPTTTDQHTTTGQHMVGLQHPVGSTTTTTNTSSHATT